MRAKFAANCHFRSFDTSRTRRGSRAQWVVIFVAGSMPSSGIGCAPDPSCVDTATCEIERRDDGGEAGAVHDGSREARPDDTISDVSDGGRPQVDGTNSDRLGTEPALDTPVDTADRRDAALQDGGIDRAPESGSDVSPDTSMPVDGQNPGDDSGAGLDASNPPGSPDGGGGNLDSGDVLTPADAGTDACTLNACGGCGVLAGVPGASCGSCGKYVCSADKSSVTCDHPDFLKVKQVSLGPISGTTCALLETGGVRCWGDPEALGDGSSVGRLSPPTTDIPGLSGVSAISVGSTHACALLSSGSVRCWGENAYGQLGDGSTTSAPTPTAEVLTGATALAAGGFHTCAVLNSTKVRCWGQNIYGTLGDGTMVDRATPGSDIGDLDGVVSISAGFHHTCVVLNSGSARCWGGNSSGALGDGTNADRASPGPDIPGLNPVNTIRAGEAHTCAHLGSGGGRCWGHNGYGQLGDGTKTSRNTIGSDITGISGLVTIVPGAHHTCARLSSGGTRCWGANQYGQLGNGSTTEFLRPPDADIPNLGRVVDIDAGWHSCALLDSGQLRCWGPNAGGALGDGTMMDRLSPSAVLGMCP
jgi:alpha-tubulin suppressor-like RCC1 family protein